MPEVSKITKGGVTYDIKDEYARQHIGSGENTARMLQENISIRKERKVYDRHCNKDTNQAISNLADGARMGSS